MMRGLSALQFIGLVVGTAVALGTALGICFAVFKRTGDDLLRTNIADADRRIDTLEADLAKCREHMAKQDAEIAELETTIAVLKDVVTGASAVAELATAEAFNHDETMKTLRTIDRRLARLRT